MIKINCVRHLLKDALTQSNVALVDCAFKKYWSELSKIRSEIKGAIDDNKFDKNISHMILETNCLSEIFSIAVEKAASSKFEFYGPIIQAIIDNLLSRNDPFPYLMIIDLIDALSTVAQVGGDRESMKIFLNLLRTHPNVTQNQIQTALNETMISAAGAWANDLVKMMLEEGADSYDETLLIAAMERNQEVIELVLNSENQIILELVKNEERDDLEDICDSIFRNYTKNRFEKYGTIIR